MYLAMQIYIYIINVLRNVTNSTTENDTHSSERCILAGTCDARLQRNFITNNISDKLCLGHRNIRNKTFFHTYIITLFYE